MKSSLARWGSTCAVVLALAACGGGGGGGDQPSANPALLSAISSASLVASNDTAVNASAGFAAVQAAGIAPVTINSPPKVNFTVFSDGAVKTGLTAANVSFAIAKLVPGTNGDPDQWVNYIYRTETATAGVGPGGKPVLASAKQATTDSKQTDPTLLAAQLVYNAGGYYTYTFKTDIKDVAQTNGVVFEPSRTHRVAIQLSYKNAAGDTVLVNPYFDFTVDASGNAVAVTDPAKTRKMTDITSCNSCHEKLALHGGGRVDTQYCVMCHNPGTTDANSGNVLTLSTMVHKIHAGKLLYSTVATGGEDYTIWGYQNSKHSYADVGFPQDLRNCTKCHTAANASTPQGDNWKTKPSKEACLTCHASNTGSLWDDIHKPLAKTRVGVNASAKDMTNQMCASCHSAGSVVSAENVHFNQSEASSAKYKMNIEAVSYDAAARKVTIKYYLSDPTNSNAAYNLVTSECTGTTAVTCASTTKYGNLRFYVGYANMVGQSSLVTEFTSYGNGGNSVYAYAYTGKNDGSNHYSMDIALPADTATAVASGTARVISIGQVKEPLLEVHANAASRPVVTPEVVANRVNVVVQNTFKELALSGTLLPRREVVSNAKCNVCHSALGSASGSNTLPNAFHTGARNTVEACVVCHDANRMSTTIMTNGSTFNESYQFKRMIHGIHGGSKRTYPFTHGNTVVGAFNKDGTSATGGSALAATVENFAAEVAWPGVGINCNACHVNNSYKVDQSPLGAVVNKPIVTAAVGTTPAVLETDPNKWKVISPKAASCTACHDSSTAITHVTSNGGAYFGTKTQAQIAALPRESCDDCHASGSFVSVDLVHGQK